MKEERESLQGRDEPGRQDQIRKKRKHARAVLSFLIMVALLAVLIFASVNIGSLQVSPGERCV